MTEIADSFADDRDIAVLAAIEDGLALCERPYLQVGKKIQMSEEEVITRLERMRDTGVIRRMGLVLQHRPLGYRANAMVVWDVPDKDVDRIAASITAHDFITLCYCRARRAPLWPYNLYCMIHGQERDAVERRINQLKKSAGLEKFPTKTLFSTRKFKQTGARFSRSPETPAQVP